MHTHPNHENESSVWNSSLHTWWCHSRHHILWACIKQHTLAGCARDHRPYYTGVPCMQVALDWWQRPSVEVLGLLGEELGTPGV